MIEKDLDAASEAREEAGELKASYEAAVGDARKEASRILADARERRTKSMTRFWIRRERMRLESWKKQTVLSPWSAEKALTDLSVRSRSGYDCRS